MAIKRSQGNFINGSFINDGTITLTSNNPSDNFAPVFSVTTDISHVDHAVQAAKTAYNTWTYLPVSARIDALLTFKQVLQKNEEAMARAISQEMGKIKSEALTESKSLSARIDLMITHGLARVRTEPLYELRAETRYHNQGVLAVIGPYNFPAHLVNAHVIPSVLLGNTVVIKPSEVCPETACLYAQCVMESGLPPGVINVVHGTGEFGRALATHNDVDGVLFTGSYKTGRALQEYLLDQPNKILALEMGGKNFAVVMDDADLRQALLEIAQGAFLTTGQRCTATSRVLVHEKIFDKFREQLIKIVANLVPSKADGAGLFGPLATKNALDHFMSGITLAKEEGAEVLVDSKPLPGGAFVTPSLFQISNTHPLKYYLGEELFGPNIALEKFSDLSQAIQRINLSPYGLSNAIFTADAHNSERMIKETKSGVLNINRSTNNAFGQMPFGGVGKSGNQRAAGIDAVRYGTFPMAITSLAYGESSATPAWQQHVESDSPSLSIVCLRHEIESTFESFSVFSHQAASDRVVFTLASIVEICEDLSSFIADLKALFVDAVHVDRDYITFNLSRIQEKNIPIDPTLSSILRGHFFQRAKPESINVPHQLAMPKSRTMLDRFYRGNFVPQEKKTLVPDLRRSRGAMLASIDDDPLVIFDAASQIATVGAGFFADTFQNAYDCNEFDNALISNCDLSQSNNDEEDPACKDALQARTAFEKFLHEQSSHRFSSIGYGASGAEANEIALDLARQNGPGGTRIIAFAGAFHGRTIMTLHGTYNKEKSGPFIFSGYEAVFLPFPELKNPANQPPIVDGLLASLSRGEIPRAPFGDALLEEELKCLAQLKEEVRKEKICAVIIEPMQCEGGDRYASNRFFSCLRALTRALKIPLIFDEVQTGFHLGREFFWFQQMNLVDMHGKPETPDCITVAKKAQLGACMSVWPNPRPYSPHIIQLKRGLLHGRAITKTHALAMEKKALAELEHLVTFFPELVQNPRACGFAFAFDMPTKEIAQALVDQRFARGFMVYIAGEKTLRFRLNMACSDELINRLFEKLTMALIDIRDGQFTECVTKIVSAPIKTEKNTTFEVITVENFPRLVKDIERIENETYEEGRRDSMDALRSWIAVTDGLGIAAFISDDNGSRLAGYAFGGPLEHSTISGPKEDPHRGKSDTFYSANITVEQSMRGSGIGTLLKREQMRRALAMKNSDGGSRYAYMSGRNRVGLTLAMNQINMSLGAYHVSLHENQYNELGASASYYRLELDPDRHDVNVSEGRFLDCQNSVQNCFSAAPKDLMHALEHNRLRGMACSKLTLSNWATPHMVRYSELLRLVMPTHLKHAYFTSGRDEVLDKGLRSIRYHRKNADIAIGFSHQWLGLNSAAARSLSHDEGQAQPWQFFAWPKVNHPALVGNERSLRELKDLLATVNADKILAIVVELIGEQSAHSFDQDFLEELQKIRAQSGIPLVFVETTSGFYRSGKSLFLSDHLSVKANMVLWYTGGQLGHVFVDDTYFVEKPLTLISTWDGDEISMARAYHALLAMRGSFERNIAAFEKLMSAMPGTHGLGCWHGIKVKNKNAVDSALKKARDMGVLFGRGFDNTVMICPKIDFTDEQFRRVAEAAANVTN